MKVKKRKGKEKYRNWPLGSHNRTGGATFSRGEASGTEEKRRVKRVCEGEGK